MLKFYWNGIKEDGSRLQLCCYSESRLINHPPGTITIHGKKFRDFSPGVHAAFKVENGTDMYTDYFENDLIRVTPSHPLYAEVAAALKGQTEHRAKMIEKRNARWAAAE